MSIINGGILIGSDELKMSFSVDDKLAVFYDWEYLVMLNYNTEEEQKVLSDDFIKDEHLPMEERLRLLLEKTDPQNKEVIEIIARMKIFVEKLEELAKDERTSGEKVESPNDVLVGLVTSGDVKASDLPAAQQVLIDMAQPEIEKEASEKEPHMGDEK